jgi:hypothetical protein
VPTPGRLDLGKLHSDRRRREVQRLGTAELAAVAAVVAAAAVVVVAAAAVAGHALQANTPVPVAPVVAAAVVAAGHVLQANTPVLVAPVAVGGDGFVGVIAEDKLLEEIAEDKVSAKSAGRGTVQAEGKELH